MPADENLKSVARSPTPLITPHSVGVCVACLIQLTRAQALIQNFMPPLLMTLHIACSTHTRIKPFAIPVMSITQLLHSPLTVPQTQQATALNDLLCYTAINDGHISWDELPKATSTVSYEALYEVILDGAVSLAERFWAAESELTRQGRKSSLCARVEYA